MQPTIFEGNNSMRIFQEEIFGPVVSVTSFDDEDDALKIANDTLYGLGAGVWSRDGSHGLPRRPRDPGRPGLDELLPPYPAHAAFGGYKQSGIGRENHKMMLDHYQQTRTCWSATRRRRWGSSRNRAAEGRRAGRLQRG